jgi:hypothetical protein
VSQEFDSARFIESGRHWIRTSDLCGVNTAL